MVRFSFREISRTVFPASNMSRSRSISAGVHSRRAAVLSLGWRCFIAFPRPPDIQPEGWEQNKAESTSNRDFYFFAFLVALHFSKLPLPASSRASLGFDLDPVGRSASAKGAVAVFRHQALLAHEAALAKQVGPDPALLEWGNKDAFRAPRQKA
jgi:hypothetical protein